MTTAAEASLADETLRSEVKVRCPEFVDACEDAKASGATSLSIHQDAFAINYEHDEMMMLATLIKYAGLEGLNVFIVGKNRSTKAGKR